MADGQISFYSTDDVNNLNVPDGAIIISKRDAEKRLADLWAVLNGNRYQIKPSYDWAEIENTPDIKTWVDQRIKAGINKVLLNYFWIEYTPKEDSADNEAELKIFANEGDDMPVSNDGDLVTLNELQDGIENGTFRVGDRSISIGGLKSAAYTESEEYTPMPVSIWSDL